MDELIGVGVSAWIYCVPIEYERALTVENEPASSLISLSNQRRSLPTTSARNLPQTLHP